MALKELTVAELRRNLADVFQYVYSREEAVVITRFNKIMGVIMPPSMVLRLENTGRLGLTEMRETRRRKGKKDLKRALDPERTPKATPSKGSGSKP